METGCYRATDTDVSISDWITLNFSAIPSEVLVELYSETHLRGDRKSENHEERTLRRLDARCSRCQGSGQVDACCDRALADGDDLPVAAHADSCDAIEVEETCPVCDGFGEDPESDLCAWPFAWGQGYRAENRPEVVERLIASGFVVYAAEGGPFDGELVFGVDGGGYSFYGAHWIPLRTLCGLATFAPLPERLGQREPGNGVDPQYRRQARAFVAAMEARATQEGDGERIARMPEVIALRARARSRTA